MGCDLGSGTIKCPQLILIFWSCIGRVFLLQETGWEVGAVTLPNEVGVHK